MNTATGIWGDSFTGCHLSKGGATRRVQRVGNSLANSGVSGNSAVWCERDYSHVGSGSAEDLPIQILAMPELEDEQLPEAQRVIALTGEMLADQAGGER